MEVVKVEERGGSRIQAQSFQTEGRGACGDGLALWMHPHADSHHAA